MVGKPSIHKSVTHENVFYTIESLIYSKRGFVDTEIWSLVSWIKILLKPHYNNIKQRAQKKWEVSGTSSLGFRTILLWESGFSVRISIFEHAISAENEFRSPRLSGFFLVTDYWSTNLGFSRINHTVVQSLDLGVNKQLQNVPGSKKFRPKSGVGQMLLLNTLYC